MTTIASPYVSLIGFLTNAILGALWAVNHTTL